MSDKLVVSVLGNRNSGKSYTWYTLFGRKVKTGKILRRLYFNKTEYILVFLINGSAEERGEDIGDIITVKNPAIVLCSMQYVEKVRRTINYFIGHDYFMYVHWLNPGRHDENRMNDDLEIVEYLRDHSCIVEERSGKGNTTDRVNEMKTYLHNWANAHDMIRRD